MIPLRVILDLTYAGRQDGTGRYLSSIARELGRRPDIDLIPARAPRINTLPRPLRLPINGLLYLIWTQIIFPRIAVKHRADLIHANIIAPRFAPVPTVVTIHDALDAHPQWRPSRTWSLAVQRIGIPAARRADLVVTGSQSAADELACVYGLRATVIPYATDLNPNAISPNGTDHPISSAPVASNDPGNGFPASSAHQLTGIKLSTPFALVVAPNNARKDIPTAVAAVAHVRRSHQLSLVLVGRGTRQFAMNHPWIIAFERLPDAELVWLYRNARLLIAPSHYEGFGLPLLEAAQFGTPVVASDIPAHREIAGQICAIAGTVSTANRENEKQHPTTPIRLATPAKPLQFARAILQTLATPKPAPIPSPTWRDATDQLVDQYRHLTDTPPRDIPPARPTPRRDAPLERLNAQSPPHTHQRTTPDSHPQHSRAISPAHRSTLSNTTSKDHPPCPPERSRATTPENRPTPPATASNDPVDCHPERSRGISPEITGSSERPPEDSPDPHPPTPGILMLHPSDEIYGADRMLIETILALKNRAQITVALPISRINPDNPGPLTIRLEELGIQTVPANLPILERSQIHPRAIPTLLQRSIASSRHLDQIINDHNIDLIWTNTLAIPIGALLARRHRIPHIWHIHEHLGDEPTPIRSFYGVLLNLAPGPLIAPSRSVARALPPANLATRIRHIPNTIDLERFPSPPVPLSLYGRGARGEGFPPAPDSQQPITIGVVGRLSTRKGILQAIEALADLHATGHNARLRIIGGPPPSDPQAIERYRRISHALNTAGHIQFLGEVADPLPHLHQLDILLVPSQRPEPFGLTILEGMAAGLPIVVTRNGGGSDELIQHRVTGITCGRTATEIAAALATLIDDPKLRANLAQAAHQAAQRYSRASYQSALQRLLTSTLATSDRLRSS